MLHLLFWSEEARRKNSNSLTRSLVVLMLYMSLSYSQSMFVGNTITLNWWDEITNLEFPVMSVVSVSGIIGIVIYFFKFLCLFLLGFEFIGWTFFKLYDYFMFRKNQTS